VTDFQNVIFSIKVCSFCFVLFSDVLVLKKKKVRVAFGTQPHTLLV